MCPVEPLRTLHPLNVSLAKNLIMRPCASLGVHVGQISNLITLINFSSDRNVAFFLGYNTLHKGYKCLDVTTGCIYISRDVVFDEQVFPFSELHENAGASLKTEIECLSPSLFYFQNGVEHVVDQSATCPRELANDLVADLEENQAQTVQESPVPAASSHVPLPAEHKADLFPDQGGGSPSGSVPAAVTGSLSLGGARGLPSHST